MNERVIVRPVIADKADLTLRERLVLAHERGDTHNGAICPTCIHGQFMYELGQKAAVREIAEGA